MKEKIAQLQSLEQNVQMIRTQLHSLQSTLLECQTALTSLDGKDEAFKFVGNIMIKEDVNSLISDLASKKERLEKQKLSFEKQEQTLLAQKKELETELLGAKNE